MAVKLEGQLKLRSNRVAYLGLPEGTGLTYTRMQGFTSYSESKNPNEYSRQYVDEEFEQTDVVGYSPSIGAGFDEYVGHPVHDFLVEKIQNEVLGTDAVVSIVVIDMNKDPLVEDNAMERTWAVIADTEGGSLDAYTYSLDFRVKGPKIFGRAELSTDELTLTFTPSFLP